MHTIKPISEACLRNQGPISEVLMPLFATMKTVFEIGSGTGQHAVFFAEKMPHLEWHPSDLAECLPGIRSWIAESNLQNVKAPIALDVNAKQWSNPHLFDAVFTANTMHFVGWSVVEHMLEGVASFLHPQGLFCVYGPFNKHHQFTSIGNRKLDQWLKGRDAESGIKDIEEVCQHAERYGLTIEKIHQLPANNLLLIFRLTTNKTNLT
ncbi:MAG: DUF938 domain-containing protein [Pseudomonadota bacterium]